MNNDSNEWNNGGKAPVVLGGCLNSDCCFASSSFLFVWRVQVLCFTMLTNSGNFAFMTVLSLVNTSHAKPSLLREEKRKIKHLKARCLSIKRLSQPTEATKHTKTQLWLANLACFKVIVPDPNKSVLVDFQNELEKTICFPNACTSSNFHSYNQLILDNVQLDEKVCQHAIGDIHKKCPKNMCVALHKSAFCMPWLPRWKTWLGLPSSFCQHHASLVCSKCCATISCNHQQTNLQCGCLNWTWCDNSQMNTSNQWRSRKLWKSEKRMIPDTSAMCLLNENEMQHKEQSKNTTSDACMWHRNLLLLDD